MRTLRVGIASYEQMKARTVAIARGEYRPAVDEPKVWFTSAESFARVLSNRKPCPAGVIAESAPDSLARLAETNRAGKIESVPDAENHGAIRLRASHAGSAGIGDPASSVPADFSDIAVVNTGARW